MNGDGASDSAAPQSAYVRMPAGAGHVGHAVGARIVRNILALGIGQVFTWISAIGLVVLLPRYLGDDGFGKLAAAVSVTDFCGLLAVFGVTTYLTKEVARRGLEGRTEVINALVLRLPLTLLAVGLAAAAAVLLGYDATTRTLVYLFCINMALAAISSVLVGALQGLQELRVVAAMNALSKVSMLALTALFLLHGYGLVGVALAWNIATAVGVVGNLAALVSRKALGGRIELRAWPVLLGGSLPFFIWQSSLLVYGQSDVIMLSAFTRDAVVGWYTAAYRIISIPIFIPSIVMAAVLPALTKSAFENWDEFLTIARRSMHVILLLTIPSSLGIMVTAREILDFLRYPDGFYNSIPLIIILSIHIPLVSADMVIGVALTATDKQQKWALIAVAAAVLNPAMNLLFIPYSESVFGNGAIGAATSTVITELFVMVVGLRLLSFSSLNRYSLSIACRCIVAGLIMSAAVWLASGLPLPVAVVIGVLVYSLASFALGSVSLQDIKAAHSYLRERIAVRVGAVP